MVDKNDESPLGSGSAGDHETSTGKVSASSKMELNRRDFLLLSASASAAAVGCGPTGGEGETVGAAAFDLIDHDLAFDFSFQVVRKEDFLVLRFDFVNLVPSIFHTTLQRVQASADTFVVVSFPSQHVFEASFLETTVAGANLPTQFPVSTRLSGPSRVAFRVPNTVENVPLTLEGLLQLISQLDLHVAVNALPAGNREAVIGGTQTTPIAVNPLLRARTGGSRVGRLLRLQRDAFSALFFPLLKFPTPPPDGAEVVPAGAPQPPFNHETAIELPYRLLLSPDRHGAWAHAPVPVSSPSGRVELWHSRLGVRRQDGGVEESDPTLRRLRAIWTRDPGFAAFNPASPPPPAIGPTPFSGGLPNEIETLTSDDRTRIVHLTSNFEHYTALPTDANPEPLPRPVQTSRLMLSAMGGFLDVEGKWPDTDIGLEEWQHRASLGRDHYVKVVTKGRLYPFGHLASLVRISERKFKPGEHPNNTALLRTRYFIVVREPERGYLAGRADTTDADAAALRGFPFVAVKVTSLVTPNLDLNTASPAFVPRINGGVLYRFSFEAMDVEGNIVRFTAPVSWMATNADVPTGPERTAGAAEYATIADADLEIPMNGQRVAFAESNEPDDTTHEAQSIRFQGEHGISLAGDYPTFLPGLTHAKVALETLRHVVGKSEDASRLFEFHPEYLTSGFLPAGNAGEVLMRLKNGELPIDLSTAGQTDRSGGFLEPSCAIQAVSRKLGPVAAAGREVADLAGAVAGDFNPQEFFAGALPKIFGIIPLTDILGAVGLDAAPKYFTKILTRAFQIIADVEKLLNDLKSVSYPSTQEPLPSIDTLLADLDIAFDLSDPTAAVAAAARIPADIDAVVAGLSSVASILAPLGVKPRALQTDFEARAQRLRGLLPGAVSDLAAQIANLARAVEFPKEIHTRLEWRAKVKSWNDIFVVQPGNEDALLLAADIRASAEGGGSAEIDLFCALEDFEIKLLKGGTSAHFLTLAFKKLEFRMLSGKKPDIIVDLGEVRFEGPLSFIEKLKELIPLQGFSDPPFLDVDGSGITAGFTLAIPNIGVGVFSLENINLGASLRIPFIGESLTFNFDFSTRENPFNLTVALLGGGGFFGLSITPKGVRMIEAALEAGARISINLGVASGSVSAMIGVYFRLEKQGNSEAEVTLTGYFRVRGQLEVLGIITISAEIALELSYENKKAVGRASIEVEIDILFFSASVTVSCERRFAGSNGDPTFYDIMRPDGAYRPWDDYLAAFAA